MMIQMQYFTSLGPRHTDEISILVRSEDLVECRLADDGSGTVNWRVNGKEADVSMSRCVVWPCRFVATGAFS